MKSKTLEMDECLNQCVFLTMEQRAEVAILLRQMEAVIFSASDPSVAAAVIRIYGACVLSAKGRADQMPDDGEAPHLPWSASCD